MIVLDYSNNPEILGRVKKQLRPYQVAAVAQGIKHKRCLFDMSTGYGKTVTCLTALFGCRPKKILILCGRAALGTWIKEIKKWFPEYADFDNFNIIRAQGGAAARRRKWSREAVFYITTYQTFNLDQEFALKHNFDAYVIDEAHKLPGHKTKGYKKLEIGLRNIPMKFMLTATWLKRHAGRGWRHLHLLDRKVFPSYWKFINRYCLQVHNGFGMEILGPQNTEEFKIVISHYIYRFHVKNKYVPDSVRKITWIDPTAEQSKIYKELAEEMYSVLESGEMILSMVSLSTFTKHRQLLNCPKILSDSLGMGGAFNALLEYLKAEENKDNPEEQHFVLFSPFKISIPYFQKILQELGYKTFVLIGGMDGMEVHTRAEGFKASKDQKSVAICTINFAESFDLGTSIRSHFLGLAWDDDLMKQAEGRLSRADSDLSKLIIHKYWLYNNTMDANTLLEINGRIVHVHKLFQKVDDVREALYGNNLI